MSKPVELREDTVRMLAQVADLPLGEGRGAAIAPTLGVWLADANELSRSLSEPEHRALMPISVFHHPRA